MMLHTLVRTRLVEEARGTIVIPMRGIKCQQITRIGLIFLTGI